MKLSVELEKWRADRPDEWKMDEFIRNAAKIESENDALSQKLRAAQHEVEALATQVDELTICFNERTAVYWQAVDANSFQAKRIDELAATVEALRVDDEAIEGLTAWLMEFEQSIDVGCGTVESSAGWLVKHLAKLTATPQQHLCDVLAEAVEQAIESCLSANDDSAAVRLIPSGYFLSVEWLGKYAESVRAGEK